MSKNASDFKQTLWNSANSLRGQMDPGEYKHIVLGLIFLKYISDAFNNQKQRIIESLTNPNSDFFISENLEDIDETIINDRDFYKKDSVFWVPENSRWEEIQSSAKQTDIGQRIDDALVSIENENKFLKGKLDKRFGKQELNPVKLGQLIDKISEINFENNNSKDFLGEIYEYFIGKFAMQEGKKGGQFYTPKHIVKTLVSIIKPLSGRIYDPCCGSGGMFVQSGEFISAHQGNSEKVSIYGQESNPNTWRLAHMNLSVRGISANLGESFGSTFDKDEHKGIKFDYILINPPFNDSEWDGEKHLNDPRWVYGTPPVGNANFAWVQHVIHKLKPNGSAGIVLGSKSLDSSKKQGEFKIRENIVLDDIVEAIILMPERLFKNTSTAVSLWIINKNKNINIKNKTLFIDAEDLSIQDPDERTQQILPDDSISQIVKTIDLWREGKDYIDIAGFCREETLEAISIKNFNLSPRKYIQKKNSSNKNKIKDSFSDLIFKSIEVSRDIMVINKKFEETANQLEKLYKDLSFKDWEATPLSILFAPKNIKVGAKDIEAYSCTNDGITSRDLKFKKKLTQDLSKNKIANKGDFVFGMSRKILNFGMMSHDEGCFSPAYKIYEVNGDFSLSRYIEFYIRKNHDYFYQCIPEGAREGKGVDEETLLNLNVLIPPKDSYELISSMLEKLSNKEHLLTQDLINTNNLIKKFLDQTLPQQNF